MDKTKNKNQGKGTDWKELTLSVIKNFLENFFAELSRDVRQKILIFIEKLKNNLIFGGLFILGSIFLVVGIAIVLNFLIDIPGAGYLIVGALLLLLGFIFKAKK
jgi:mannose/fructose/N-acetylgalactosamine-specific phosphotransferase system component IIC